MIKNDFCLLKLLNIFQVDIPVYFLLGVIFLEKANISLFFYSNTSSIKIKRSLRESTNCMNPVFSRSKARMY